MRKRESLKEKYTIETFRIKKETLFLYNFLEFYMIHIKNSNISKDKLFDLIVRDSIKYIVENNIHINHPNKREHRIVKGFSIGEDTMDLLNTLFSKHEHIYKAEIIEFLITLYLRNNIDKKEIESFMTFLNCILV